MSIYEAWRITYQSSEAAARAAYDTVEKLHAELVELKEQMQAIGAGGVEPLRKTSADTSALRAALEEAEAALEVATSRLSARGANYPVHVTSEARALEIVRHALGKSHADHFRGVTKMMLPTAQVLEPVEQRQLDIGKAIERACQELPEGAEIQIYLERGAGTVHMTDWDGNEFDHFDEDHDDFACRINAATDGAIAAEQVAAHVRQGGGVMEHLFEFWWSEHMPDATQEKAWAAWVAAPAAKGVGVAAAQRVPLSDQLPQMDRVIADLGHAADEYRTMDCFRPQSHQVGTIKGDSINA